MSTLLYLISTGILSLIGCGVVKHFMAPTRTFADWWDSDGVPVFMVLCLFIGYALAGPSDPRFWDGSNY